MLVQESTALKTPVGFFKVPKDGKQMIGDLMKMQKEIWIFVQWDEQMKQRQPGSSMFFGYGNMFLIKFHRNLTRPIFPK